MVSMDRERAVRWASRHRRNDRETYRTVTGCYCGDVCAAVSGCGYNTLVTQEEGVTRRERDRTSSAAQRFDSQLVRRSRDSRRKSKKC
jgi:hypothetical protein